MTSDLHDFEHLTMRIRFRDDGQGSQELRACVREWDTSRARGLPEENREQARNKARALLETERLALDHAVTDVTQEIGTPAFRVSGTQKTAWLFLVKRP